MIQLTDKEKLAIKMAAEMIKVHEGFRSKPYKFPGGNPTIGYGHEIKGHEKLESVTEQEAEAILVKDLLYFLEGLRDSLPEFVYEKLTENKLAALLDFIYNIGIEAFNRSNLRRKLTGNYPDGDIASEFLRWVYDNGVKLEGLCKRRLAEAELYLIGEKK